jgi:hypothetical protein
VVGQSRRAALPGADLFAESEKGSSAWRKAEATRVPVPGDGVACECAVLVASPAVRCQYPTVNWLSEKPSLLAAESAAQYWEQGLEDSFSALSNCDSIALS